MYGVNRDGMGLIRSIEPDVSHGDERKTDDRGSREHPAWIQHFSRREIDVVPPAR